MTENKELISTTETATLLHRAERTIQTWGQRWEQNASQAGDAHLPSSPLNGLRRSGARVGRALYHLRDIDEFVENSTRETIGQPLVNWRKERIDG